MAVLLAVVNFPPTKRAAPPPSSHTVSASTSGVTPPTPPPEVPSADQAVPFHLAIRFTVRLLVPAVVKVPPA
jgi:hypothetical protein